MKKFILFSAAVAMLATTSCDPNAKTVQEEDTTSEEVLQEDATPSQYEGSTGVLDEDDNNMDANENIQLKKQEFKGSFASPKTQNYEVTVLETEEYTFRLESANQDVKYVVANQATGEPIFDATSDTKTVTLEPGKYVVTGTLDLPEGEKVEPETEFTIYIE